ncbi:MAG: DMT family transporter [Actinomycetaceae bacterium]|nr:DMT family transporter [Actinomycetaceae bacterium]
MSDARFHTTTKRPFLGVLLVLCSAIGFSASGIAGEYLFLTKHLSPEWTAIVRLWIGGVIVLGWAFFRGRGVHNPWRYPKVRLRWLMRPWKDRKNLPRFLLLGICGIGLFTYTSLISIAETNATTSTMIGYTAPAVILLWTCARMRRVPTFLEILCVVMSLLGVFLIATHGKLDTLDVSPIGLLWCVIAMIMTVIRALAPGDLYRTYSTSLLTGWGMLISAVILTIVDRPWRHQVNLDLPSLAGLSVMIFGGTVIGTMFFLYGVKLAGPVLAALVSTTELMSTMTLSVLLLGALATGFDVVGCLSIVAAVAILSIPRETWKPVLTPRGARG